MLNYIWFGLMAIALVVAAIKGTADGVTKGAVDSASTAVQIAIGLVGVMTLWLGIMRVAEAAGLVSMLGRVLRPVLRWLFPDVPPGHPAAGSIVLAIAANVLGLSNAATPLGIKAMEELQTLNPDKETASNAQVTFMAMTTASVQVIPSTMIGVLVAAGSTAPTAIIGSTLAATFIGTIAAVLAAEDAAALLSRVPWPRRCGRDARGARSRLALGDTRAPRRHPARGPDPRGQGLRRLHRGAKEGFDVAVRIIPFLVGILVAIGMFRGSGAMDLLMAALRPIVTPTGFPPELVPLAILRSLSGSGSLAVTTDLIKTYGPDSLIARMAATMYGSSETTFYVLAVYFGAVSIRRTRHAVPAALIGDAVAVVATVAVCYWMFA